MGINDTILEQHAPEDGTPAGYIAPEEAPLLHLNGSSGEVLADGYREAIQKLTDAYEAIQKTAPHGRDYYTQPGFRPGEDALTVARHAHERRLHEVGIAIQQLKRVYFDVRRQQYARGKV